MPYRRTENVVRRLAAREQTILDAAQSIASESGMGAVQIAPVAHRADIAAGTVYRYFPSKNNLIGEVIASAAGRELAAIFQRQGITRIAAMGLPLDPNRHQAMLEVPSADAEPGTIVQEMQAGYTIKDRLLRPALVGVAKKPE